MFVSAAMALACDNDFDHDFHHGRKTIHGVYGATNMNGLLGTPYGFNENFVPNGPASAVSFGVATGQMTYTFNRDGTGTAEGSAFGITIIPSGRGSTIIETRQFTYDITDDGVVTIHTVSGEGEYVEGPLKGLKYTILQAVDESGYISQDHKTITLTTPKAGVMKTHLSLGFDSYSLYNCSRVLVRIGE
jgi:hypothetical protein